MSRAILRAGAAAGWVAAIACAFGAQPAAADAGWFESGDTVMRMDLQLLNDAEVIRLPVNEWPLPRAAVRYALDHAKEHFATNAAVSVALARLHARLDATAPARRPGWMFDASISAGDPGLLRDFDTVGREEAEARGRAARTFGERAEVSLAVTAAANPDDDRPLRLDGSHATVQLGNWLLSANSLDRWWGPSHESSLILSNNARPMPTLSVTRATARPFETRWLSWLGPWRMDIGVSRMETHRQDIDEPLFLAWRIEVMPLKDLEIGFSRTAQFCGKELECNLNVFGNLLAGNDNVGIDATPGNEPGNQMAGFDLRWNSPIGNWPYAIYSQYIGEDESSYVPAKYLAQLGFEAWKPLARGGLIQAYAEYSSTTCSANTGRGPYYNCAYTQGRFDVEGYRYHGRVIGYTADSDAENYALGLKYSTEGGELWTATLRNARLNRDGVPAGNTVSPGITDYSAIELGWKGKLFAEDLAIDFGVESIEPRGGDHTVEPFGFIGWRRDFHR